MIEAPERLLALTAAGASLLLFLLPLPGLFVAVMLAVRPTIGEPLAILAGRDVRGRARLCRAPA